ncbi:hypothetical protein HELRODRAFT_165682 [Helobdella robusta]|uniref:Uncharacterized protein n=1 Tax=Helobdella robusta TaxID=6412 RepID=T1EX60_HELRO|nr:hypothetical protein HELRODRAFT_165682 [Helobdella robusta]ESN91628.1 hypothetical protein HELRODRAFT_165682 [Helobdella robusta]
MAQPTQTTQDTQMHMCNFILGSVGLPPAFAFEPGNDATLVNSTASWEHAHVPSPYPKTFISKSLRKIIRELGVGVQGRTLHVMEKDTKKVFCLKEIECLNNDKAQEIFEEVYS